MAQDCGQLQLPGFFWDFSADQEPPRGSLPIPRVDGWIHPRCLIWGSQGCSQPAPGMPMGMWVLEASGAREFRCPDGAGQCWEQAAGAGGFIPCMYKRKE